jgi:SPP1 gp7 family putative phage head morphogenesis protein
MAAIVAKIPPIDTKATRRIDKTELNPDGRQLRRYERQAADTLHDALQKWARALLKGVTAESVAVIMARLDDREYSKPLRDAMIGVLQEVAQAGAEHGRKQVERAAFGIKRENIVIDSQAVDWTLANADAAQWAIEYGYQLIQGITDTTRKQIATLIRYFVDNSITINELRDQLMAGNLFSKHRATMIAVTEVTRAFQNGSMAAWRASGVVEGREWQTAVDERVCPLCGPLHGKVAKLNEPFGFGISDPPRHVMCRCYTLPVVIGDAETFQTLPELMGA